MVTLLAGCYAPDLRDCVVACTSHDECGPDQACGTDGRCASRTATGTCSTTAAVGDAGPSSDASGGDAAPGPDAPAPPDAPATIALTVQLSGRGSITVVGVGTCGVSVAPCTYAVPPGVARTVIATPAEDWSFDRWQSVVCTGHDAACSFTPAADTTVQAKFRNEDG